MDKKEYNEKLEEIKGLIAAEDYSSAAQIADSIDWKRVRNVQTLVMISEVYEAVERYEDSKTLLLRAYRRSPVGRTVLYRLVEVTIKLNQFDEAIEYYSEYVQAAPRDNSRYILKYKIYRARGSSVDEQISILKEYLKQEYNEKWAYELAKLQISAGRTQDALSTCDDLVLWFHSGKYVIKALELKRRYAPLTPKQQEIYDSRFDDEDAAEIAEEGDDTSYLKQAEAFKRADRADQQQEKIKSELARDISRVTRNRELMENNAAAQNLQPDKMPEENAAPEAAPAGKSLTGAASAEQAITEPAFTEAASAEQAIAETVFTETAPAEQAITETAFTEAAPAEQAIAETAFAGAVSAGTEDTGETFTGAALNEAVQEAGEKAEEGPGEAASAGSESAESAFGEAVPGAAENEESVPAEAAAEAAGAAESDAAGFVQDTVYAENAEPEAGEPSLTDADLYAEEAEPETAPDPYAGIRSDYDPQQMQEDLISLGYSCGKWGADGEYGDATEMAVENFQRDHNLPVTGAYDAATREAMEAALDEANKPVEPPAEPQTVKIVGGDCYVRTAPNTSGRKLGVAHEGDRLPYGGETSANGWNLVEYRGQNGWVSGKYARVVS